MILKVLKMGWLPPSPNGIAMCQDGGLWRGGANLHQYVVLIAFRAEQIELHHMVRGTEGENPLPDEPNDGVDLAELRAQVPTIAIDINVLNAGFAEARNTALQHLVTSKKSALHRLSTAYQNALR